MHDEQPTPAVLTARLEGWQRIAPQYRDPIYRTVAGVSFCLNGSGDKRGHGRHADMVGLGAHRGAVTVPPEETHVARHRARQRYGWAAVTPERRAIIERNVAAGRRLP